MVEITTLITAMAAIVLALVPIVAVIKFMTDRPWKEPLSTVERDNKVLSTKVDALTKEIDTLTTSLLQESERTDKEIDKLEQKIEKLTDLIIKMITDSSNGQPLL